MNTNEGMLVSDEMYYNPQLFKLDENGKYLGHMTYLWYNGKRSQDIDWNKCRAEGIMKYTYELYVMYKKDNKSRVNLRQITCVDVGYFSNYGYKEITTNVVDLSQEEYNEMARTKGIMMITDHMEIHVIKDEENSS